MKIHGNVLKNFKDFYHLSGEQLNHVENGFYNFLKLHKGNENHYAMLSDDVDAIWHYMILHHEEYLNIFVEIKTRRNLTHKPFHNDKKNNGDIENIIEKTLQRYAELGLNPPLNILALRPIDLEKSTVKNIMLKNVVKPTKTTQSSNYSSKKSDEIDIFDLDEAINIAVMSDSSDNLKHFDNTGSTHVNVKHYTNLDTNTSSGSGSGSYNSNSHSHNSSSHNYSGSSNSGSSHSSYSSNHSSSCSSQPSGSSCSSSSSSCGSSCGSS